MKDILLRLPWFRAWLQKPSQVDRAWFDGFETGLQYARDEQQAISKVGRIVFGSLRSATRESRRVH